MIPVIILLMHWIATSPGGLSNAYPIGEAEDVIETIARVNEGLYNLIQEDILPNKNRNAAPCTETGCRWPMTGKNSFVPFTISDDYNDEQRKMIQDILRDFNRKTCVQFIERSSQRDYIQIFSGSGCWSYVGRIGGRQLLSLRKNGCLYTRVIQHEILHGLGFYHEHSRSDRDESVTINWENIIDDKERNFDKVNTINYNISYDYNSVMQYRNNAFSKNGLPTIVANDDPNRQLGAASSMSDSDYIRVNLLYQCTV
ncbi:low choriolytic enzyme-like [Cynoglossus semilaevis]|uniref:Metalloendopeptidase n=1 Tax=Cynoglossus semilaevis TaxID=244447 RepID=A0A3P8VJI0_CYNSE|nr:low choriolytic enzyme-like [Cynoglossus semilaevis]